MDFFALLDDPPIRTVRIPVNQTLQNDMEKLFKDQEDQFFLGDPDEIPFSASYTPDSSEVAFIANFDLPQVITVAVQNPLNQDLLKLKADAYPRIKGIFAATGNGTSQSFRFQAFERRQALDASGLSILLSRGTFKRLSDPGLTLDTKLAAVYKNRCLFFNSFFTARRIFDLTSYYREATDMEIEQFAKEPTVALKTPTALADNADEWVRRRIALIRDSRVMKTVPVKKIIQEGSSYGVTIETSKLNGKDQIVFPDDKAELKALLRFLDQNYYTSGLTGDRFVANSKRPLAIPAKKKPPARPKK